MSVASFVGGVLGLAACLWMRRGRSERARWWVHHRNSFIGEEGNYHAAALLIWPSVSGLAILASLTPLAERSPLRPAFDAVLLAWVVATLLSLWWAFTYVPRWVYPKWAASYAPPVGWLYSLFSVIVLWLLAAGIQALAGLFLYNVSPGTVDGQIGAWAFYLSPVTMFVGLWVSSRHRTRLLRAQQDPPAS